MYRPLVSLALPIKNGLPGLTRTLEALQRQTYQEFELVVQDGGSTDASLDAVRAAGLSRVEVVSASDTGIAQAYNRAFGRCRGPLVVALSADEYLEDHALETLVEWHREHPDAAYCYGQTRIWRNEREMHAIARAGRFDLLKFLLGEYVPPAGGGVYNREVIGTDFYFDERLKTCPDFDLFLRLGLRFGPLQIVEKDAVMVNSIRDRSLMTFHPPAYDRLAQDKLFVLDRFFAEQGNSRLTEMMRRLSVAAVYRWLAALVLEVAGETPQLHRYLIEAGRFDPGSERLAALVAQTHALAVHVPSGAVIFRPSAQPLMPTAAAELLPHDFPAVEVDPAWDGARVERLPIGVHVRTAEAPWSYAATILVPLGIDAGAEWHWLNMTVDVKAGQVGLGILDADGHLKSERLLMKGQTAVTFLLQPLDRYVLVRNGSLAGSSEVNVTEVSIYRHTS